MFRFYKTNLLKISFGQGDVKGFRIKSAANIGIQGRIRVHMRTKGHDLGEHLDITEVWDI